MQNNKNMDLKQPYSLETSEPEPRRQATNDTRIGSFWVGNKMTPEIEPYMVERDGILYFRQKEIAKTEPETSDSEPRRQMMLIDDMLWQDISLNDGKKFTPLENKLPPHVLGRTVTFRIPPKYGDLALMEKYDEFCD